MRSLLILALSLATAYLGLCAWFFLTQRSQIYFPVPESNPPGTRSIRLKRDDATLKIWVVERPGPRALVYFGGNAENVSANLASFSSAFPHHSLYLVNYRGYGGSTGRPSESALVADALAVYDQLHGRYPQISIVGRSLGTGIAVQLAAAREVHRLVLVTPYDSLADVAAAHMPIFPVRLLMRDRFDSASRAQAVAAPVLAIIASDDEIIPRGRSEALVNAFPRSQVRAVLLDGATHNSIDLYPGYLRAIGDFLGAD
jgi:pimeloyl-ACP methyl ester carboxylesterase